MMAASLTVGAPFAGVRPCQKPCSRASGRGALVCRAQAQDKSQDVSLQMLVAGAAAALLISASPAHAGVKFEKVQTKKMFQGSGAPASVKLPSVPSVPEVKKPGEPIKLPSFGIDAGTIALPAAVLGIGGLGFVASKVDPGFADVFREAVVKDSTSYAGYEQSIKSEAEKAAAKVKGGAKKATQKIKATGKEAGKKSGLFGFLNN
ncbi:g13138 [Coccomyxa viridis]|uniref:G13138 protein n=1 Tax=Coccomyxa viridis TaxID=1274662 RepID=A0ABP1GC58_9CHLO